MTDFVLAISMPGLSELIVIGVIVMFLFGPRQIPKLAKSLGDTIRELRNAKNELSSVRDEVGSDLREIHRTAKDVEREIRS